MTTRIYQATTLSQGSSIKLDAAASHHLARVLRAKLGTEVILFNGQGDEYAAHITHIDKKTVTVTITAHLFRDVESPITIHLGQGIARGEKMDFIIQKAVELGATHIHPLITERCNVRLSNEREAKRLQHWQAIIISAAEQSGRCILPELAAPLALDEWLEHVQTDLRFVLSPHTPAILPTKPHKAPTSIALLIGPEGGLSEHEIALAEHLQFQALRLGPRILRTETATIAAISTIQSHFGDFQR